VARAMSAEGLEACLAFGAASRAVMEVTDDLARTGVEEGPVAVSYEELLRAHDELQTLFAGGVSVGVPELALSVMVLAERTAMLLAGSF